MCTEISIVTKNGDVISGRTNEFGMYYNNNVSFFPRKSVTSNSVILPSTNESFSDYAIIGINCGELFGERLSSLKFLNDGINEKGLAVSLLYYPGYAEYNLVDDVKDNEIDLLSMVWQLLAKCASVVEVKAFVEEHQGQFVVPTMANQPGHFFVIDRSGSSIVLEPDNKGRLEIKKSNGVMTNSPSYEFHLTNLGQYANLQQFDTLEPMFDRVNDEPALSYGTAGGFGVPGDTSPASRFIKACYYAKTSDKNTVVTPEDGVLRLIRILNNFDIIPGYSLKKLPTTIDNDQPKGEVPTSLNSDNIVHSDFDNTVSAHTDHTIVKDLTNLKFYYKDWSNQSIRYVAMDDYDLDSTEIVTINMVGDDSIKAQRIIMK